MTETIETNETPGTGTQEAGTQEGGTTETGTQETSTQAEEPAAPCTLIEAIVISHLSAELKTSDVYAERPAALPDEFWIIEKTSSGETNHIQTATIAVQSVSRSSMLRAAEMSKAAEKAMKTLINVTDVSRCKLNSAYNFTDTETKEYRYQAVFDITYMEGD